jgi:hypothetical protein
MSFVIRLTQQACGALVARHHVREDALMRARDFDALAKIVDRRQEYEAKVGHDIALDLEEYAIATKADEEAGNRRPLDVMDAAYWSQPNAA